MRLSDYYGILGLTPDAGIDEIKRAYRKKARLCHPDLNSEPDAKERFILLTEAYEFLISNFEKVNSDPVGYQNAMDDWKKYRQSQARRRANAYARASYISFKKSQFYKTTRIFDATGIVFGLIISVLVIVYTITGYIYSIRHPIPGDDKPTLFAFISLLIMGFSFLILSLVYLKVYMKSSARKK